VKPSVIAPASRRNSRRLIRAPRRIDFRLTLLPPEPV
jgi:hypothetical protein